MCLVIAGTGFLFLLRDLGKSRREPALTALACVFGLSAFSYAVTISWSWVHIGGFFGIPNLSAPLAQGSVLLMFACQATVLAYWTRPPAEARRISRRLFTIDAVAIASLITLFTLLTPATTRPVDFTLYYAHDPVFQAYTLLYFGTFTVAQIYLAWVCWKYARRATTPSITVGLRIIAVGAVITLGQSGHRILAMIGASAGFSVKGFEPYAWLCGDLGATLTQLGYFLPILVRRTSTVRDWTTAHLRYRRLRHLWAALDQAEPGITLRRPTRHRDDLLHGRSAAFPLLRRRTEIRQGQKLLRRFLDPAVRTASEARHTTAGLTGADLAAAVTADQIHAALLRHHANDPVEAPAEYADAQLDLATTEDELLHLIAVAAHFTPPRLSDASDTPSTTSGART